MKTAVVLSDSHGNRAAFEKLNVVLSEADYIIHLGDTSGDGRELKKLYPDKTYTLNGNCDVMRLGEDELTLQIEGVKIFACHGDRYRVKSTLSRLAERAKESGCTVALYGHTHRPGESTENGVTLFNPGCMTRYSRNTYLYLVINGDSAVGKIVALN